MNITFLSVSWSNVILNWSSPFHDAPLDFADQYELIITSYKRYIMITTNKTQARIDNLTQLTSYELNIQAWNRLGYGPFLKEKVHFITPGDLLTTTSASAHGEDISLFTS